MRLLQREEEFAWFVALLQREGVRSYLEIGSKFGASLDRIARSMPKGSRVVSVDLPGEGHASRASLSDVVSKLRKDGYDARIIWGDSTYRGVIDRVKALAPFDAVFIDANHTLPYVTKDWENYGPLGRIVAFHDVAAVHSKPGGYRIEAKTLWDQIKGGYRHEECCLDTPHNGIGVLWRD